MSVTSSIPSYKYNLSSSHSNSSPTPSSSSSSSSSSSFKCSRSTTTKPSFVIRSSNADGPLRRPVATPPLRQPTSPSLNPVSPSPPPPTKSVSVVTDQSIVTMEFQRKMAKELQEYFKQKKLEQADQGPAFGWVAKNEIGNGRWAMFGFAVGMLTEFATGSNFVDQVKILLSNFGIVDLE
ncbi:hypothetical protein IFM89_038643 [Coptis chinensis]|uniref:Uncharacterized protein n=1 Tax=Coptis chinensis TaxID=261450 RepID=A0A835M684_9MAGN|nr:hypothetical protein IFM89_038643 [Coptis chinensis]